MYATLDAEFDMCTLFCTLHTHVLHLRQMLCMYLLQAHLIYQIVNSSSGQTALRIAEKKELREFIRHMSLAIQS